jgi:PKHD-type hydroxylase
MMRTYDWTSFKDGLDKQTCDKIIKLAEEKLPKISDEEETLDRHIENLKDPDKTDIVWTTDKWIYDLVWDYMRQANEESGWKYEIHAAENMQIARYKKGMFYDWHPDGRGDHLSAYKDVAYPLVHNRVRKLSFTVLLNDDFEGGEFQFATYEHLEPEGMKETWIDRPAPGNQISIPEAKAGTIIVFPSDMWHRVKPVTKGIRYSLAIWFLGPPYV